MPKKEGKPVHKEYLGFFVLAIGFAILFTAFKPGGITGLAVHDEGAISGNPTVNVVNGDEVQYSGLSGFGETACNSANCNGEISGNILTIPATGVQAGCTCQVALVIPPFTAHTITLNIAQNNCQPPSSCSPTTNNLVVVNGPGVGTGSGHNPNLDPNAGATG